MNPVDRLRHALRRVSIFSRVLVGNSVIIIIGAVAGTLMTHRLSSLGNLQLILLFASLGIALSLLVNYWLIKTALQPIRELRNLVSQIKEGQAVQVKMPETVDADIQDLIDTVNLTLTSLDKRTTQLRALSEQSIHVQEEERKRIARLLHDDTAQAISTMIIRLEEIERHLPEEMDQLRSDIARERRLATQTLEDLRKNIWDLRPSILDDLGLAPAIRWYARTKLDEAGIAVEFDFQSDAVRLRHPLETMVFRSSQEAVNNILRHAEAQKVTIRLRQGNNQVCLEVEDDGKGFDVWQTTGQALSKKQFGLLGIQERALLVGGDVQVTSWPGKGTCVRICVPTFFENTGD